MKANVDLIFGLLGETLQDMEKTADLMQQLIALGARVHGHTSMPLPQTGFAGQEPGRIGKSIQAIGGKWPGMVYGNWQEQREMANKIARYLREGIL